MNKMEYNQPQTPEDKMAENADIDIIYKDIQKTVERARPNPAKFAFVPDPAKVEEDLNYVIGEKRRISQLNSLEKDRTRKLTEIVEGIVYVHGESSNWFGEDTHTVLTSEIDRFKNKISFVLEQERDSGISRVGLAIDIIIGDSFDKKLEEIKQKIENNEKLGEVEYFVSESLAPEEERDETEHKARQRYISLHDLPRAVIILDIKTAKQLADYHRIHEKSPSSPEGREALKAINNHFFQFQALDEMIIQFESEQHYAEKRGNKDKVKIYKEALEFCLNIKNSKQLAAEEGYGPKDDGTRDEEVMGSLREYMINFGKNYFEKVSV